MIKIKSIYGNCPVQGEGFFDEHEFYYRARGTKQSVRIIKLDWEFSRITHEWPSAGWIEEIEAIEFIKEAYSHFKLCQRIGKI